MKLKWWGHASFLITTDSAVKIITDPYNEELPYKKIDDEADLVTVSHDHYDHNAVDILPGEFKTIKHTGIDEYNEIKVQGIVSFHDDAGGSKRGENIIYIIDTGKYRICHFGDLGHNLQEEQRKKLTNIDIVLIPVGGYFTIDASQAYEIVQELKPGIIVPMHFKTDILDFPIDEVNTFLDMFEDEEIKRVNGAEIEIDGLPEKQTVYLFDYVK